MVLQTLRYVCELRLNRRTDHEFSHVAFRTLLLQQCLGISDDIFQLLQGLFVCDRLSRILDRSQRRLDRLETNHQALGLSPIMHDIALDLQGCVQQGDDGVQHGAYPGACSA